MRDFGVFGFGVESYLMDALSGPELGAGGFGVLPLYFGTFYEGIQHVHYSTCMCR